MGNNKLIYEEPQENIDTDILDVIKTNQENDIIKSLISMSLHGGNLNLLLKSINMCSTNNNVNIKRGSMLALGHAIRLNRDIQDENQILEILNRLSSDNRKLIQGHFNDLIGDIEIFNPNLFEKFKNQFGG